MFHLKIPSSFKEHSNNLRIQTLMKTIEYKRRGKTILGHLAQAEQDIFSWLVECKLPDRFPPQLQLDPTNRCQMRKVRGIKDCEGCSFPTKSENEVSIKEVVTFLDFFQLHGGKSVFLSGGGEPGEYTYFKELVTYFAVSPLVFSLNSNGLVAKTLLEMDPHVLRGVFSDEKPTTTLSISVHTPSAYTAAGRLVQLKDKSHLNYRVRTTLLIHKDTTKEEIMEFISRSQEAGVDIAAPKPNYVEGDVENRRVFITNQKIYDLIKKISAKQKGSKIKIESMRLDRIKEGFIETKPRDYDPICVKPFYQLTINAMSDLAVCCQAKYPSIAMDTYHTVKDGFIYNMMDFWVRYLWTIISFENRKYCIYGGGYMEENDYWNYWGESKYSPTPNFISILKEAREKYRRGEIKCEKDARDFLLTHFNTIPAEASLIKRKIFKMARAANSPQDIENKIVPFLKKIPDAILSVDEKMDLSSLILASSPASPIAKADLRFMFQNYPEDIARKLKKYAINHPERTSLNFAIMGGGNGLALYYIRMMTRLLVDIPVNYYAFDIDINIMEKCRGLNPDTNFIELDFLNLSNIKGYNNFFDMVDITNVIHEVYSLGGQVLKDNKLQVDRERGISKIYNFLRFVKGRTRQGGIIHIMDGMVPQKKDKRVTIMLKTEDAQRAFEKFKDEYIYPISSVYLGKSRYSLSEYEFSLFLSKLPLLVSTRPGFNMARELQEVFHYFAISDFKNMFDKLGLSLIDAMMFQQKVVLKECLNKYVDSKSNFPPQRVKMFVVKDKKIKTCKVRNRKPVDSIIDLFSIDSGQAKQRLVDRVMDFSDKKKNIKNNKMVSRFLQQLDIKMKDRCNIIVQRSILNEVPGLYALILELKATLSNKNTIVEIANNVLEEIDNLHKAEERYSRIIIISSDQKEKFVSYDNVFYFDIFSDLIKKQDNIDRLIPAIINLRTSV